jgi:hypothetical protein
MNSIAKYIIELVIAVYITAYLLPPSIVQLANASKWTGAPAAIITIGTTVLSILIIMGIAMVLIPDELKKRVGI